MTTTLEIERHLKLSPDACFSLWADPDELRRWWGPKDSLGRPFAARSVEWIAKVGATWFIEMVAPDGSIFRQAGEILEVDPPHLLKFSFHWIEDGGRGPVTQIAVRFSPDGSGTRMVFTQSGFADADIRDGHVEGWNECLDRFSQTAAKKMEAA